MTGKEHHASEENNDLCLLLLRKHVLMGPKNPKHIDVSCWKSLKDAHTVAQISCHAANHLMHLASEKYVAEAARCCWAVPCIKVRGHGPGDFTFSCV